MPLVFWHCCRSRKENFERALEHERVGNKTAAFECYQKAVDITPAIAFRLIKVLHTLMHLTGLYVKRSGIFVLHFSCLVKVSPGIIVQEQT